MSGRTVTAELGAYLWSEIYGPQDLAGDDDDVVRALTFRATTPSSKYVLVGRATITVELLDEKAVLANKVTALRAEKRQTLADAQAKATRIESQIQQLLAITHEPGGAA